MLIFQNLDHRSPTAEERAAVDVERVIDAAIAGLRELIADDRARAASAGTAGVAATLGGGRAAS
jgi:hypothetical protein